MKLKKGKRVHIWYKYPYDYYPRSVSTKVIHTGTVADAVSKAIGRDYQLEPVLWSKQPTVDLLNILSAHPNDDILYALAFAAIQPPRFFPHVESCVTGRRPRSASHSSRRKRRKV